MRIFSAGNFQTFLLLSSRDGRWPSNIEAVVGMGTAARLNAIAEALASLPPPNASLSVPLAPSSQRLRDTGKEQSQKPVVPPRLFTCITNARQAAPLTSSQRDRMQRLKDIQEGPALAGKEKQSEGGHLSNHSSQKRTLSSAPETEPPAKRHKSSERILPCTCRGVNNQEVTESESYPLTALRAVATVMPAAREFEALSDEVGFSFLTEIGNSHLSR